LEAVNSLAGQGVGGIKDVISCEALVHQLVQECVEAQNGCNKYLVAQSKL
jgi:hypothetical protein